MNDYDYIKEIPNYPKVPLGRVKDLRGQKFKLLTPLYRTLDKGNSKVWVCQCDCGNITTVRSGDLKKENGTKSCGCLRHKSHRKIDLTNQRFGSLTVIKETDKRIDNSIVWECLCDCGNTTFVISSNLIRGNTQSCGCLRKKLVSERSIKDLTGQKIGKLTILKDTGLRKGRSIVWQCKCECGTICNIPSRDLLSGNTTSCGCLRSKGEEKVAQILSFNNIIFNKQIHFEDCKFENKYYAYFDFGIYDIDNNLKFIIEYDGDIHFRENIKENGWNSLELFEERQLHDEYKNQWCKENNIPLIRIPYWHYDDLCLEDLLLETTQFRVV